MSDTSSGFVIPEWAMGQMVSTWSCLVSSVGLLFMKISADEEAGLPVLIRWRFMVGFACMLFNGTFLDVLAFSLAPLSMLAPLGGLVMVFSCLLARCVLNEPLMPRDIACIGVLLAGVTTVSIFGPHPERTPGLDEIQADALNPSFLVFAAISVAAVVTCIGLLRISADLTSHPLWTPFSAYAAASCGGITQICLKMVATAARVAVEIGSCDPFFSPVVLGAIGGLLVCAPTQLYLLNSTLGSSPVKYAVPTYQALLVLLSTAAGGTFFLEFRSASPVDLVGFSMGMLVAMSGILALALQRGDGDEPPAVPLSRKSITSRVSQSDAGADDETDLDYRAMPASSGVWHSGCCRGAAMHTPLRNSTAASPRRSSVAESEDVQDEALHVPRGHRRTSSV